MNNRIIFNQPKNSNKIQTCFEKFVGKSVTEIKVRNLVISKIVQKVPN